MKEIIKRTIYLAYYFKQLDWKLYKKFFYYTKSKTGKGNLTLWIDIISSNYKYNTSLMDYFLFRFFEKGHKERVQWVGTGYKYEFDLKMNPKKTRHLLENKIDFYREYAPFVRHANCTLDDLKKNHQKGLYVLNNPSAKVVVKDSLGQCGWDVEILNSKDYSSDTLVSYMENKGFDLAEEFIQQHDKINELSPSGLNTVRVITMINNQGNIDILGARMRISVNSYVDNLASGNIACAIDIETGKINGKGVYSDITKEAVTHHPLTGKPLLGFQIPKWKEVLDLCITAALHRPENRGIGWDVAITKDGPEFIEGNHNWCKILWQIPIDQGLKSVLEKYD